MILVVTVAILFADYLLTHVCEWLHPSLRDQLSYSEGCVKPVLYQKCWSNIKGGVKQF